MIADDIRIPDPFGDLPKRGQQQPEQTPTGRTAEDIERDKVLDKTMPEQKARDTVLSRMLACDGSIGRAARKALEGCSAGGMAVGVDFSDAGSVDSAVVVLRWDGWVWWSVKSPQEGLVSLASDARRMAKKFNAGQGAPALDWLQEHMEQGITFDASRPRGGAIAKSYGPKTERVRALEAAAPLGKAIGGAGLQEIKPFAIHHARRYLSDAEIEALNEQAQMAMLKQLEQEKRKAFDELTRLASVQLAAHLKPEFIRTEPVGMLQQNRPEPITASDLELAAQYQRNLAQPVIGVDHGKPGGDCSAWACVEEDGTLTFLASSAPLPASDEACRQMADKARERMKAHQAAPAADGWHIAGEGVGDPITERRLGRFRLATRARQALLGFDQTGLHLPWAAHALLADVLVVDVQANPLEDCEEIGALCRWFDPVPLGNLVPTYNAWLDRVGDKTWLRWERCN